MIGTVQSRVALSSANPAWLLMAVAFLLFGPGMAAPQEGGPASAELRALYEADQADRQFSTPPTPEQWQEITSRDALRQARVYELLRTDQITVAEDFYHAAMVLQHGEDSEPILLAHVLATAAAYMGDDRGRWLSAAALDRYLYRTRMPQRFGTQYVKVSPEDPFQPDSTQPWSQGPYIRWLPDSVREIYGVPSLEEQADRVPTINPGPGDGS